MTLVGVGGFLPAWSHPELEEGLETAAGGLPLSKVDIREQGDQRIIRANGIPNHATGRFPNPGNPNSIEPQDYLFRMPLHPTTNAGFTPVERQPIGVALNGVVFDPGTAEYWNNDPSSGWRKEGIVKGKGTLGMDRNLAHVQPNGAYHYHGIPAGLVEQLPGSERKLIGYAADGFPIYTQGKEDRSSYRLKSGSRSGGAQGPGGSHDGTYTQDFEFVSGRGNLDAANGRTGVTTEYPEGTYFYVATEEFPFYPRQLKGTPDPSFQRKGPGREAAPRDAKGPDPIRRLDRDGDGKISKDEAPPPMRQNFMRHDTDGDGWIDADEAKSLPRPGQGGPEGPPSN